MASIELFVTYKNIYRDNNTGMIAEIEWHYENRVKIVITDLQFNNVSEDLTIINFVFESTTCEYWQEQYDTYLRYPQYPSVYSSYYGGVEEIIYNIDYVEISSNVKKLSLSELLDYAVIKTVDIKGELEYFGWNSSYVDKVNINMNSIKTLGNYAFIDVDNLNITGTLENLEVIETFAFDNWQGTDLRSLRIGKSLKEIKDRAFSDCKNLAYFNEGNCINCYCGSQIFYKCPCIELLTIGDDATCDKYGLYWNSIIYISLGTGSNQDEDGYQLIELNTNNIYFVPLIKNSDGVIIQAGMDYEAGYVRVATSIIEGSDLIHLQAGLNKVIIVKSYEDGDIELALGNIIKKVKLVEITDANASPIHIAVGNKVKALRY